MALYSVGDIAVALGVSVGTIRNWTENEVFESFFSDMAVRRGEYGHAKQREYTEDDLYVLNTIRTEKTRTASWEDVAKKLQDDYRDKDLPESAALVLPETRAESFQLLTIARAQIESLQTRITELEDELLGEREARRKDLKEITDEKSELWRMIGRLEFMLEQAGIDPKTGKQNDE